jgi:PAS domain S-box-containing protein
MRILSVDDKSENIYLMESLLCGYGYEVISAHNGIEALQKLEEQPFDLIISDILMPKMDGFQLCREVKKNDKLKQIPFVFYTATYTDKKDEDLALSLGASRFIIKPTEPEKFMQIITEVISDKEEGKLPVPQPVLEEEIYLKTYNESLIHKIEDKLEQIEASNRKLMAALDERNKEIAERKLAEEALRVSEAKYRRLYDSMMDAYARVDMTGNIKEYNEVFQNMLGYEPEEITALTYKDLTPERWRAFEAEIIEKQILLRGYSDIYEKEYLRKDGSVFPVELRTFLLRDDEGNPFGMWSIVRDITERKQSEEERKRFETQLVQVQKLEAIGTLASGIAHDFNNILSAIIGYAELSKVQMRKEGVATSFVDQILNASARAKDLVQQILTFSRQAKLEMKPVMLSLIMKEALSLLKATLPSSIEIRQNINDPGLVMSEPTQIHQIMMNICTNAAQAMDKKGGILDVRLGKVKIDGDAESRDLGLSPGPYLSITISDNGQGIYPEVMKRIFEPYFTTKDVGQGTGLGLAVVHGIVRNHGGAITCKSTPGEGTTFIIYLPELQPENAAVECDDDKLIPTGTERILVIDDEPVLAELVKKMMESLGYSLVTKTSSEEALDLFRKEPDRFDLVITDMTMPGITGDRLAEKLLEIRKDIPIILCTGYNEHISDEKAKEIGIKEFIMKPLMMKELACTVRKVLNQR